MDEDLNHSSDSSDGISSEDSYILSPTNSDPNPGSDPSRSPHPDYSESDLELSSDGSDPTYSDNEEIHNTDASARYVFSHIGPYPPTLMDASSRFGDGATYEGDFGDLTRRDLEFVADNSSERDAGERPENSQVGGVMNSHLEGMGHTLDKTIAWKITEMRRRLQIYALQHLTNRFVHDRTVNTDCRHLDAISNQYKHLTETVKLIHSETLDRAQRDRFQSNKIGDVAEIIQPVQLGGVAQILANNQLRLGCSQLTHLAEQKTIFNEEIESFIRHNIKPAKEKQQECNNLLIEKNTYTQELANMNESLAKNPSSSKDQEYAQLLRDIKRKAEENYEVSTSEMSLLVETLRLRQRHEIPRLFLNSIEAKIKHFEYCLSVVQESRKQMELVVEEILSPDFKPLYTAKKKVNEEWQWEVQDDWTEEEVETDDEDAIAQMLQETECKTRSKPAVRSRDGDDDDDDDDSTESDPEPDQIAKQVEAFVERKKFKKIVKRKRKIKRKVKVPKSSQGALKKLVLPKDPEETKRRSKKKKNSKKSVTKKDFSKALVRLKKYLEKRKGGDEDGDEEDDGGQDDEGDGDESENGTETELVPIIDQLIQSVQEQQPDCIEAAGEQEEDKAKVLDLLHAVKDHIETEDGPDAKQKKDKISSQTAFLVAVKSTGAFMKRGAKGMDGRLQGIIRQVETGVKGRRSTKRDLDDADEIEFDSSDDIEIVTEPEPETETEPQVVEEHSTSPKKKMNIFSIGNLFMRRIAHPHTDRQRNHQIVDTDPQPDPQPDPPSSSMLSSSFPFAILRPDANGNSANKGEGCDENGNGTEVPAGTVVEEQGGLFHKLNFFKSAKKKPLLEQEPIIVAAYKDLPNNVKQDIKKAGLDTTQIDKDWPTFTRILRFTTQINFREPSDPSSRTKRLASPLLSKSTNPNDFGQISNLVEVHDDPTKLFRSMQRIGKGGFSEVYCAIRVSDQEKVALKKVKFETDTHKRRNIEAISLISQLKHPNLVNYERAYIERSTNLLWIVMEYSEGGTLSQVISHCQLEENPIAHFAFEILKGIEYIHGKNIIHRDIKPENLLVDLEGRLKIADFGWSVHTGLHKRLTMCGTLDYLPPEMVEGNPHDRSVDLWCLGILMYEFLVGCPPFESEGTQETYDKILKCELKFPSFVTTDARDMITRLLALKPSMRLSLSRADEHPWIIRNTQPISKAPPTTTVLSQTSSSSSSSSSSYSFSASISKTGAISTLQEEKENNMKMYNH
eukprot:TRINITY_DN604_c0_g1_i2.p1 TRINITY_DN604_c0_g1~~TRINITY_DN604_c0_g1_i2.p1  ORF type:complete len:1253 (+),score=415.72 TRINITY_DN604_c0_g1_i2:29-3760(+)